MIDFLARCLNILCFVLGTQNNSPIKCKNYHNSMLKRSGPDVIKLISYSTQLRTKFNLLISVKMPTIVDI